MWLKAAALTFAAVLSGVVLLGPSAKADTFAFSFVEDSTYGNVGGIVTGELIGLINNSTSPATQVLIETFPSDFSSIVGSGPLDAVAFDDQVLNSFTEVDGTLVGGWFYAYDQPPDPSGVRIYFSLNYSSTGTNNLTAIDYDGGYGPIATVDDYGLAGLNVEAVPEPGTLLLPPIALAPLALLRLRRLLVRRRLRLQGGQIVNPRPAGNRPSETCQGPIRRTVPSLPHKIVRSDTGRLEPRNHPDRA